MGHENADYDRNLRQINRDKHYWEQKRQNVKENDKKLSDVLEKYNEMLDSIKTERKAIINKAKEEARTLLSQANRQIENTIREIRNAQAEKERTKQLRQTLETFKTENVESINADDGELLRKMEQIRKRQQRRAERNAEKDMESQASNGKADQSDNRPIGINDMVSIDGDDGRLGKVLSIKGDNVQIAMGNMLTTIKLTRLKRISKSAAKKAGSEKQGGIDYSNVASTVREKKLNFKSEIDVRGMRTEEALQEVSRFIDEAVLCEASQVRILHGKGNGILRQMIRQYLKSQPCVEDARDENVQFGGAGITVVDMK